MFWGHKRQGGMHSAARGQFSPPGVLYWPPAAGGKPPEPPEILRTYFGPGTISNLDFGLCVPWIRRTTGCHHKNLSQSVITLRPNNYIFRIPRACAVHVSSSGKSDTAIVFRAPCLPYIPIFSKFGALWLGSQNSNFPPMPAHAQYVLDSGGAQLASGGSRGVLRIEFRVMTYS